MLLFICTGGYARDLDPVRLFDKDNYRLNSHMEVLKDETNSLNIDDIVSGAYQREFYQDDGDILNLGVSPHTYWVKLDLLYPDQYPNTIVEKQWYLEVGKALLGVAELYLLQGDGSYLVKSSDSRLPFSRKEISHVNSVFPISTVLGQTLTLYIKVQNISSALHFPLVLWSPSGFSEKVAKEEFVFGLFFGGMLILLAYNMFLYSSIRDDCYLYYIVYLGSVTLFELFEIGHGAIQFNVIVEALGKEYTSAIVWVSLWGGTKFFTSFLHIAEKHPRLQIFFNVAVWIIIVSGVMSVLKKDYISIVWVSSFAIFFFVVLLVTTSYCWIKGNDTARFFFFAWSFNAIGLMTYAAMANGVLPSTWITIYLAPLGVILEAVIFSFSLADRIKVEGKKKLDADKMIVENMSKYRSVFDNALEGMYWMSMEGKVTNANASMARIMGCMNESDVIKNSEGIALNLYGYDDDECYEYLVDNVESKEVFFCGLNGRKVWAHHSSRVICDAGGNHLHVEGAVVDITEIKEKEKAIRDQLKEVLRKTYAISETQEKSQLLSMMSQKIRTPLTSIIGFSELLKEELKEVGEVDFGSKNKHIEIVAGNSRNLMKIINNILDFSKLEAGKFYLEKMQFSIVDLILEVRKSFFQESRDKGVGFEIVFSSGLPRMALGDPAKILQILNNLCDNAIKYSESGMIKVDISWKDGFLMFEVSDQGEGIGSYDIDYIFCVGLSRDKGEGVLSVRKDDSGLGLPISKGLAVLMGGDVTVSSELGKGSVFGFSVKLELEPDVDWVDTFEVPSEEKYANRNMLKESSDVPTKHLAADPSPSKEVDYLDLSGTVLLAEDNVVNQALISRVLSKFGVSVVIANDGVEASACCLDSVPDLILMDVNMPNRNGIEAVRIIREINKDIPIYMLTAETDQKTIEKAMEAGSQGVLSKPLNRAKLYEALEKHLTSQREIIELPEPVQELVIETIFLNKKCKRTIAEVAIKAQSSRVLLFTNNKPKNVLDKGVLRFSDALPQINEFVRDLYENKRWVKLEEVVVQINRVAGDCKLYDLSRNSSNLISALQEGDFDEVNKWIYWVDKGIRQNEKNEKISAKKR
ncbi:hypothetical protein A9Q81_01910 [Gammaproteobacteria bacterium 42_54_T18]|nr:hypothetical protein A9Q81_01910 [Gammaproteobacteria bacterium 42_54_T18]